MKSFRQLVEESLHEQQLDEGKLRDVAKRAINKTVEVLGSSIGQPGGPFNKLNRFASKSDIEFTGRHLGHGKKEDVLHNAAIILNHPHSNADAVSRAVTILGSHHPLVQKALDSEHPHLESIVHSVATQATHDLLNRNKFNESKFTHPAVSNETIKKVASLVVDPHHAKMLHSAISDKIENLQHTHGNQTVDRHQVEKMSEIQNMLKHKV